MSAFQGFREVAHTTSDGVGIFARVGGQGPALLLVHGYPQTHRMWRHVPPRLSERFTVICADLRGYGQSSKPQGSDSHVEYSKRAMAADLVSLMNHLGYSQFTVLAHDRGARVAHRLALDFPGKVDKMILLDIAPTLWMYEHTDMAFATGYWHWFFLIQPSPQTEEFILSDPYKFWDMLRSRGSHQGVKWDEEDVKAYQANLLTPEGVHATCEDYRAAATIDLEHDRADLQAGRKLEIPSLKVIWGKQGMIDTYGDVVSIWRGYCSDKVDLSGQALECGHYVAEENPDDLLRILDEYL